MALTIFLLLVRPMPIAVAAPSVAEHAEDEEQEERAHGRVAALLRHLHSIDLDVELDL